MTDNPTVGTVWLITLGILITLGMTDNPTVGMTDNPTVGMTDNPTVGMTDNPRHTDNSRYDW